jgi:hypothetical protein
MESELSLPFSQQPTAECNPQPAELFCLQRNHPNSHFSLGFLSNFCAHFLCPAFILKFLVFLFFRLELQSFHTNSSLEFVFKCYFII